MLSVDPVEPEHKNHPLAFRMAVIAFLNQNITIACVWGSFSVLLTAVEGRLGVGRELSSLAGAVVNLTTALCAPIVGIIAVRHSLRQIMLVGSMSSVAGFTLLAFTHSFPLYLLAYGALLGPGMAVGVILPGTLVTRWFSVNRGKALGIISTQIIIAAVPLLATWTLGAQGLPVTYAMLAGMSAISAIANLFVVDRPPGSASAPAAANGRSDPSAGGWAMPRLLRTPRFWGMALVFIASTSGSVILTAHMVPIARSWGLSATLAATLLTIQSAAGVVGALFFGWIADRLGGVRALTLIAFDAIVLWLLLLIHPGFAPATVIMALIGLHGAGVVPVLGITLAENFGRDSFSRAYGLVNLINLPFSVACVPAAALVYARTGSYAGAIIGEACFLGFAAALILIIRPKPRGIDSATPPAGEIVSNSHQS